METAYKILALAFSLMILAQGYAVRRVVGTWLFPACLFSLFWFGYTFLPLALLFTVPIEPTGIAYILICALAFSLGSIGFNWRFAFQRNQAKLRTTGRLYSNGFLKSAFYLITLGCLVFLIANSLQQGISVNDLVFNFYASSAAYTERRSSDEIAINVFGQLSIVCSYLGVILGGFLITSARTRVSRWAIVFLSFLPSVLVMVTQSAKGMLFLCIVLFYAAVLVCRMSANDQHLLEKKHIKTVVACVLILLPLLIVSFVARGLYDINDNEYVVDRLIYYFASYSFGHIYAFSDWFSFTIGKHSLLQYPDQGLSYGFYSLMAIFKLLGSDKVTPPGVFDEYFSYGDLLSTNIYTMFRGLILDFGFIVSIVIMFIAGLLFHLAFFLFLIAKRPVVTAAVFIFMLGFFYTSFIISIFIWNSIYVSFVLLCAVLWVNKLIQSRPRPVARFERDPSYSASPAHSSA